VRRLAEIKESRKELNGFFPQDGKGSSMPASSYCTHLLTIGLTLALSACGKQAPSESETSPQVIEEEPVQTQDLKPFPYPEDVMSPDWMEGRMQLQLASAGQISVDHSFRFTDQIQASGITFHNKIVDDAGKDYKAVHYDHGNGLAVADVNGDGRLDLYFTTQLGSNELWINEGDGKFANRTPEAIAMADKIGVTASFADTDNDGDPDLFVTTVRGGNHFFENDGKGGFTDRTESSGLGYSGHSSSGIFFDYDRDGLLDLFLCNVGVYTEKDEQGQGGYYIGLGDAFKGQLFPERQEMSILYRNSGNNRFENVTTEVGLEDYSWTGDASPIDANNDGWTDLYVLNMQGHDEYYENVEGKSFKKRSREVFPKTPWGSMGIKVFDFNNDGQLDFYLTDMHSDMSQHIGPNREKMKSDMKWPESDLRSSGMSIFGNALFRNSGDSRYEEISEQTDAENYWPWGLSIGDLNADGFEDAFITSSMNYPFRYGVNSLLLNDRGQKFRDAEFILGVEPRREGRTAKPWFTLDPLSQDKDHPLVKEHNITEPVEVWAAVGSRSSVILDIDGDGDLDIITNEFNDIPMVLISNLAEKKAIQWLAIKLKGTQSNSDALGAVVTVKTAGGMSFTKVNDGVSGYLSHSVMPLYFGLGDATRVEAIEVRWPSGTVMTFLASDALNQQITLQEQ
jgi:hypothetical protein